MPQLNEGLVLTPELLQMLARMGGGIICATDGPVQEAIRSRMAIVEIGPRPLAQASSV